MNILLYQESMNWCCHSHTRPNKRETDLIKYKKIVNIVIYTDFSFFVDDFDLVLAIVFLTTGISLVPLFTGVALVAFVAFVAFCLLSNNQSIIGY